MFKLSTSILIGVLLILNINLINCKRRSIEFVDIEGLNKENNYYSLINDNNERFKRDANDKPTINASDFAEQFLNKTLSETPDQALDLPENFNKSQISVDLHVYYNITYYNKPGEIDKYWIDMKNVKEANRHEMLSNAHRRAATVRLQFKFPFYGYKIENITIATGGFLFLGEAVHTWLAATQYIAPLMANFNTSINKDSNIYYYDNSTAITIQWDNVYLQGVTVNSSSTDSSGNKIANLIDKPFSFQATLKSNGEIIFAYKNLPYNIAKINEEKHPVKVGISDAYIIDRTIFFIRRKTIYEYHKAELKNKDITNGTIIQITPLPTCNIYSDCNGCTVHSKLNSSFECSWCEATKKCSDGYDRHRQEWIKNKCDDNAVTKCSASINEATNKEENSSGDSINANIKPVIPINTNDLNNNPSASTNQQDKLRSKTNSKEQTKPRKSGFALFFILMCLVIMIGYWAMYAYKNPQSRPGQFLIKYRPAQWKFNNNSDQSRLG